MIDIEKVVSAINYNGNPLELAGSGGGSDTLEIRGVSGVTINADYDVEKVVAYISPVSGAPIQVGINSRSGSKTKEITFIADSIPSVGASSQWFYRYEKNVLSVVEKIEFVNIPFTSIYQAFQCVYGGGTTSLKTILGLDMRYSGTGNYVFGNAFSNLPKLENVTFVPNTFGRNTIGANGNTIDFSSTSVLTDESLVSIANGLCSANTKEVKFHTTQKARIPLIFGTVSQRTDDFSTYDFFTVDSNGTVTLEYFITQIKGWTIA